MTAPLVVVDGLAEFSRNFRKIAPEFTKAVKNELKAAGGDIAEDARRRYVRHYPGTGRRAARRGQRRTKDTIRVLASIRDTRVAVGGARYPWVFGQEFGSERYAQFRPWTGKAPGGVGSNGRFLWPAARAGMDDFVENKVPGLLDRAARAAFPEH